MAVLWRPVRMAPMPEKTPHVDKKLGFEAQKRLKDHHQIDDSSMVAHRSTNLMYFSPICRYVDLRPVL